MNELMCKIKKLKNCWSWKRIFSNIVYLIRVDLKKQEEELIYKIKDETLEECVYEFEHIKEKLVTLDVLDGPSTLEKLKNSPKSFTRFGDGEIQIIQGKDQPFQKYDPVLARKMTDILMKGREDLYVGLNYAYFESPMNYAERNKRFYRIHGTHFRRFFTNICDPKRQYLDAACFGAYFRYGDEFDYEGHYNRIKELFKDKDIVIISGEGVIEKLEYDIFELANSKQIIHGPRINAFSEYDIILNKVKENVNKKQLICLVLGMTATAMVADLTDMGYMAWDLGHIAKDYNSYMTSEEKTQENMDRFWAPD